MVELYNFYGGPGTGKSTAASQFFAMMKSAGYNAELVQEYVKGWAWEKRVPVSYDQFYFFGKQARREYTLFKHVDYIVTDSPVSICPYYASVYGTEEQKALFIEMARVYYNMMSGQVRVNNIWLNRVKAYNPKGRFQNEEEARAIDVHMKAFFKENLGFEFIEIDGSTEAINQFFEEKFGAYSEN